MRKLMYLVLNSDGRTFETASYAEATAPNREILKTFLAPIDERTDAERTKAGQRGKKMRDFKRKNANPPC